MAAPVSLYTAKTQLSRLVDRAAAGEEIVIAKSGRPMARLVAYRQRTRPRKLGGYEGKITVRKGFDTLHPDVARAFAGESE
jgi:prevent-host-death family protein